MSRVVYLHVGAPKTGTTYLQDRLGLNARSLAEHGVHVPTGSPLVSPALSQFRAALDLLGQDWGGAPGHAQGAWEALVKKIRRRSGTVIVSHEILAPAPPEAVARAMADLGEGGDTEVHVVYSARDLARQLPAAWQESVKQGRKWSYRRFLNRSERGRTWFQRAFDLPGVLGTWGAEPAARARARGHRPRPRQRAATSCGCGSAAPSASTRPGRRWTASAPTAPWASPRPSWSASSTGGSSAPPAARRSTTS